MKQNSFSYLLKAGYLVGTFDILAAFIQYVIKTQKNPIAVLKFIASGVFGSDAFTSGNIMALFGLLFHYIIALSFTFFFFWIYPKLVKVIKNKFLMGSLYGLFIWLIMQLIVLPLSRTPALTITFGGAATAILILICCIGIPLSFFAGKKYHT